ncbi:hypothetical protein MJO29_004855 [Puccinia striiformis f. sp. tritici]|nr:hypothetical protein MJO29_004855 [Puccinia striiformis f. sp. tritici]
MNFCYQSWSGQSLATRRRQFTRMEITFLQNRLALAEDEIIIQPGNAQSERRTKRIPLMETNHASASPLLRGTQLV